MNTLCHWLGFATFWLGLLAGLWFGILVMWEADWFRSVKRRYKHLAFICRMVVLGAKPYALSRNGAHIVFAIASRRQPSWRTFDWWERRLAAYLVRYNRRVGFTES